MSGTTLRLGLAVATVIVLPASGTAAGKPVTFSQGRRADPPGQMPVVPRAGLDRADVAAYVSRKRGPWARSIKQRVATRQMPPWHIDRSVGVQKFKNDMSLSDEQIDTIVALGRSGRAAGQSGRHAAAQAGRHRRCTGRRSATATARPTSS